MKLGMPALVEMNTIEENVKLAKKLNLDFVELNLDLPYCNLSDTNLNKIIDKYQIDFTIHLSEKFDIADFNSKLRNLYISEIENTIELGSKYNIKKYNLHLDPGIHFSLPNKKIYIYDNYKALYLEYLNESFKKLNDIAKKYDVIILFENIKPYDYLLEGFKCIENYNYLYLTLDVGHDMKSGNNIQTFFEQMPTKIKHMHLHDYDGKNDHTTLGTGIIDIKEKLNFAKKYNADIVIEVKREAELIDSVKYINTYRSQN